MNALHFFLLLTFYDIVRNENPTIFIVDFTLYHLADVFVGKGNEAVIADLIMSSPRFEDTNVYKF